MILVPEKLGEVYPIFMYFSGSESHRTLDSFDIEESLSEVESLLKREEEELLGCGFLKSSS